MRFELVMWPFQTIVFV